MPLPAEKGLKPQFCQHTRIPLRQDLMPLPAEKGLKQEVLTITTDNVIDLMPLPAEKGLKPPPLPTLTSFALRFDAPSSRKRIETRGRVSRRREATDLMPLPAEKGLKPIAAPVFV